MILCRAMTWWGAVATVKEDDLVVDCELELMCGCADSAVEIVAGEDGGGIGRRRAGGGLSSAGVGQGGSLQRCGRFWRPLLGRTLIGCVWSWGTAFGAAADDSAASGEGGQDAPRFYGGCRGGGHRRSAGGGEPAEVHTASVPLELRWLSLRIVTGSRTDVEALSAEQAGVGGWRCFTLQSIGEAQAYGSAVINYIITGSPVDELRFRLAKSLMNVDFVGRDVGQWREQDGVYVVKLTRKVIGDYNLAVTFTQPHGPGEPIRIGALHCEDVQAQSGYVVVTSHLDLKLRAEAPEGGTMGLLAINMDNCRRTTGC